MSKYVRVGLLKFSNKIILFFIRIIYLKIFKRLCLSSASSISSTLMQTSTVTTTTSLTTTPGNIDFADVLFLFLPLRMQLQSRRVHYLD